MDREPAPDVTSVLTRRATLSRGTRMLAYALSQLARAIDVRAQSLASRDGLLAMITMTAAIAQSLALGQDANWDLKSYHFYNAFALAHNRLLLDLAPAGYQTFFNPLLDLPFYLLVSLRLPATVTGALMAIPSGAAAFFAGKIAWAVVQPLAPRIAGLLWLMACIVGVTGAAGLPLVGSTMTDPHVSAVVLAAVYLAVGSATKPSWNVRAAVLSAGLLAGCAAGLKLTAASYAIALFIGLMLSQETRVAAIKVAAQFGMACFVGFALFAGPWMVTLYRHFDSPLFPYYNNVLHSPFWEQVELADLRFRSQSALDLITIPFRLLRVTSGTFFELDIRDGRLAAVMVGAVLTLALSVAHRARAYLLRNREHAKTVGRPYVLLFAFFLVGYVLWVLVFTYYRYALPLEMCSGIVVIVFVTKAFRDDKSRAAAGLVVTCGLLFTTIYPDWGRVHFGRRTFEISVPPIEDHSLVLLTDRVPAAYVIPYFPSDARFVSPWWTVNDLRVYDFTNPHYSNLLQRRINQAIASYDGPLYAIGRSRAIRDDSPGSSSATLTAYGLAKDPDHCRAIRSNLDGDDLAICRLHRVRNY